MWCGTRPQARGMMVITFVACALLAAAESGRRGLGDQDAWAMDETTGSAGSSGGKSAPGELALSDEQRGRIYDSVMRIPDAPVAQAAPPAVADALPPGVPMQDLPAAVARDVPPVQGHKFVKFDDRIVGRSCEPPGGGDDPALPPAAVSFNADPSGQRRDVLSSLNIGGLKS
jgi:hypothetical protein